MNLRRVAAGVSILGTGLALAGCAGSQPEQQYVQQLPASGGYGQQLTSWHDQGPRIGRTARFCDFTTTQTWLVVVPDGGLDTTPQTFLTYDSCNDFKPDETGKLPQDPGFGEQTTAWTYQPAIGMTTARFCNPRGDGVTVVGSSPHAVQNWQPVVTNFPQVSCGVTPQKGQPLPPDAGYGLIQGRTDEGYPMGTTVSFCSWDADDVVVVQIPAKDYAGFGRRAVTVTNSYCSTFRGDGLS